MNEVPDVAKANSRSDKLNECWSERPHFHFGLVSPVAHQNSFILRNRWLISCEVESMSLQCSMLVKNDFLVYFGPWGTSQMVVASYLDVWMKKVFFYCNCMTWMADLSVGLEVGVGVWGKRWRQLFPVSKTQFCPEYVPDQVSHWHIWCRFKG